MKDRNSRKRNWKNKEGEDIDFGSEVLTAMTVKSTLCWM
jgi:hypothetical protein